MLPKKAPPKAPAASSSKSAPIAPIPTLQTQPPSQPAPAGMTKPAMASIPDITALQAEITDLKEEQDILSSIY